VLEKNKGDDKTS